MANIIMADKKGGSGTISIAENGTYNVAAFAEAEVNVPSSGGGYELLGSGVFTKTDFASAPNELEIPWTLPSGKTIYAILAYADEPVPDVSQTYSWKRMYNFAPEMQTPFSDAARIMQYKAATGNPVTQPGYVYYENGHIIAQQRDANYRVQNNTYNWFVWGGPAE